MDFKKGEVYFESLLLGSSSIVSLDDTRIFLKNITIDGISEGMRVSVLLYLDSGIKEYDGIVDLYVEKSQLNIRVIQEGDVIDRRNNVKVSTNFPIEITELTCSGEPMDLSQQPVEFRMLNLCVGGALLEGSLSLELGDRGIFPFSKGDQPIDLAFQIIRVEALPTGKFLYGCMFPEISDAIDNILCSYIFRRQVELHKEKKLRSLDND